MSCIKKITDTLRPHPDDLYTKVFKRRAGTAQLGAAHQHNTDLAAENGIVRADQARAGRSSGVGSGSGDEIRGGRRERDEHVPAIISGVHGERASS